MENIRDEAFLCYLNVKNGIFNNTSFNFDNKYVFDIGFDKRQTPYTCTLCVSKRKGIMQPKGFWSDNISTVNIITGENGAGKTRTLKHILNNIGSGITTMNGEGLIYIVNKNDTYIVYHNYSCFIIKKGEDAAEADVIQESEYYDRLRDLGKYEAPFDNRRYWKHLVFFSNYFGTTDFVKNNKFIIDVSRDKQINEVFHTLENTTVLFATSIQDEYRKYRNLKILNYMKKGMIKTESFKSIVSIPNLLRFKLSFTEELTKKCADLYDKERTRFPNKKWVGKKRYPLYCSGQILREEEKFEFEAALNKFSVGLMCHLMQKKIINQNLLQTYINELAETEDKTGIVIAKNNIQNCPNVERWMKILNYLENDSKRFVLQWQTSDEFIYYWEDKDVELVEELATDNLANSCFSCDLVGTDRNGFYSSGEESRFNFLISMFDVLDKIKEDEKEKNYNRNIILLLDELDAFFHPKYQINLVDNLIQTVSTVFKDYYVQILMTSNTPLEISDFPASNITYLSDGSVKTKYNEISSFGSNVCNLLKNNFYINSTMGEFAKKKIDKVINFLTEKDCLNVSKEEVRYTISIIGEPIIKDKLQKMYYKKYPEEIPNKDEEVAFYKNKIQEIELHFFNGKNLDNSVLNQLEDDLVKLTHTIREIKGETVHD